MVVRQPQVTPEIVQSLKLWKKEFDVYGYSPWVRVTDVRKLARRHLHRCDKQNRIVHLLSDGEYRAYQILLWRPNVISVFEQVPLDLDITLDIARELKVVHHRNYKNNAAYVVSTDFIVQHADIQTGQISTTAYCFKYWDQLFEINDYGDVVLKGGRTIQKLKIEREYWRRKGIEFKLISEQDTTKERCWNLDWFSQEWDAKLEPQLKIDFSEAFLESWYLDSLSPIQNHIDYALNRHAIKAKTGITLFKVCALEQILPLDLSQKLKLYYPVNVLGAEACSYV